MNEQVVSMFNNDKAWLEGQPDMIPWDEGARQLAEQLEPAFVTGPGGRPAWS